ncbi:hypothetical protein [Sphingobacterium corticibacter]|uniref:Uncharacterized protein n=1 Tax=Sphingobacterium corticibacter TaxID=2171749 RepID=A0A2T8HLH2_9SPHI|nr:hypothetical protein [Sphingobacterium corticibacter]PVH26298.1 hypothetical protein DC487_01335 [Sphingobacterium corticibacter]
MKLFFPKCIIVLLIVFGCTRSNEDKAHTLIEDYIAKHAHDPESYESVEFGNLDPVDNLVFADQKYQELQKQLDIESDLDIKLQIIDELRQMLDSKEYGEGFAVIHTYRAKNSFGAKTLSTTRFYINKDLSKVVGYENE